LIRRIAAMGFAVAFVLALVLGDGRFAVASAQTFFTNDPDYLFMQHIGNQRYSPAAASIIARFFQKRNPRLSFPTAHAYARRILKASRTQGVDPLLVAAIVVKESNANPKDRWGGCIGLMQIKWKAHRLSIPKAFPGVRSEKDLYSPYHNIDIGTYIFANYLRLSRFDTDAALNRYKGAENTPYKRHIRNLYGQLLASFRREMPGLAASTAPRPVISVVPIRPLSFTQTPYKKTP